MKNYSETGKYGIKNIKIPIFIKLHHTNKKLTNVGTFSYENLVSFTFFTIEIFHLMIHFF